MSARTETSDAEPLAEKVMTFRDHIMELRRRLVRVTLLLVVGFFALWEFRVPLFEFLSEPIAAALGDNGIYELQALSLTESIVVYLKTVFMADLILLSPYIFWELWAFISPGLYAREKRFILPLTAFSVAFFLLGSAFAYTVLLPFLTDWLVNLAMESGNIDVMVTLSNTYSFAFTFLMMFGLVFELPLVLFFLALWGSVSGKSLLKFWRYFVVISFIVSGILTPPDPLSQIFMAVPLNVLYGFGVIVAYTVSRARESGRPDASRVALRAMALSLLGFLVLAVGLFSWIAGLPQKPLYAYAPDDAAFVAGLNPRVLSSEKSVLGLVRATPAVAEALDAMAKAGHPLDEITDGMLTGDVSGQRALILRREGLGEAMATHPGAIALDSDTLLLGSPGLTAKVAAREPETPSLSREEERLISRLTRGGPLWVWLRPESPARATLLGVDNAAELGSTGAILTLIPRRQLIWDLPDRLAPEGDGSDKEKKPEREARQDRIEARIEAARVAALSLVSSADAKDHTRDAILAIAAEIERLSDEGAKQRLSTALAPLKGDQGATHPKAEPSPFPALSMLATELRGVSVRREEARITITAELADGGLTLLHGALAGLQNARP